MLQANEKHREKSFIRNKRLLYLTNHPEIISIEVIREKYPILVAFCLGKEGINQPFSPEMTLADRLIYNMQHKAHHELVLNEFGENDENEDESATDTDNNMDRIDELIQLGRELFLAGKWEGFDYELVDRFQIDHSSKEELQDLEDAYFDFSDTSSENYIR